MCTGSTTTLPGLVDIGSRPRQQLQAAAHSGEARGPFGRAFCVAIFLLFKPNLQFRGPASACEPSPARPPSPPGRVLADSRGSMITAFMYYAHEEPHGPHAPPGLSCVHARVHWPKRRERAGGRGRGE